MTKQQINEKKGLSISKEFSDHFDSVMEEIAGEHKKKVENPASPKSVPASAWQNYGQTTYLNRMPRYAGGSGSNVNWKNKPEYYPNQFAICPKGICGTISSAALLAYYDDYQDPDYIPYILWKNTNTSDPKTLVITLFAYIDQGVPSGSVASNLKNGINTFITVKSLDSSLPRATSSIVPQNARNKINAKKPVCISTFAEPTYSAHWLLAYDYANYNSTTYFKCIDNWGSYSAVVRINSVTSYVYIQG